MNDERHGVGYWWTMGTDLYGDWMSCCVVGIDYCALWRMGVESGNNKKKVVGWSNDEVPMREPSSQCGNVFFCV